ncbi:Metallo-dependent phosphatase [Gigaspora margarita]|uniref:Metallo-dependent phosphatase n=2 Tax=Gigaspora margarita TaxID=4874 RepID=A0A8H3X6S0_GIGMA|nr:Metallo-dependent phosphatase [Gigaspora margarita]
MTIFVVTVVSTVFFIYVIHTTIYFKFTYSLYAPTVNNNVYPDIWNLTIIHTNDVHSHYDQINEEFTDCTAKQLEENRCFGGIARHKTVIDRLRKENKNSLLLDGGDQFQGTLFFTHYNGMLSSKVLNLLGYNITTIGNHEFDNGPETLAAHFEQLSMPIICANINTTLNPLLGAYIKPYHIFEEYSLAVIGYITEYVSNAGPTISFIDPIPVVQHYVDEIHSLGINRIVTLSHRGYKFDKELAAKTHGIAVHIGGHSHSFLSNDVTSKDYSLIEGPYPTIVKNAEGEDTLIVQAFWSGKYIGHLDISFNKVGKLVAYSGAPILIDQSIPQDLGLANLVSQWRSPFDKYTQITIGNAINVFDQSKCQIEECTIGNLIADSLIWYCQQNISSKLKANSSILNTIKFDITKINAAFINAGEIRAGLLEGPITKANILTIIPFNSSLVILPLTGKNISDLLETVVGRSHNIISGEKVRSFIQVSGIRFKYDSSKPIFGRLIEIRIWNWDTKIFESIVNDKIYNITTIDFVANGGDGLLPYPVLGLIPFETENKILTSYILEQKNIIPYIDGRIQDIAILNE